MPTFTLSPYVVKVRLIRVTEDHYNLDSIPCVQSGHPTDMDLLDVFGEYLERYRNVYVQDPDDLDKMFRLTHLEVQNRDIKGIIETGASGIQAPLYNMNLQQVTHTRQVNEAEMHPFYFLMHFPRRAKLGIIILQRFHNEGIRTVLFRDFKDHLKRNCPTAVFDMNRLAESAVLRQFMRGGRIIEVSAVKHTIPTDIAQEFGSGLDEVTGRISMSMNAGRLGHLGFFLDKINPFLNRELGLNELVEIREFEPDTVKVRFAMNDVERTFDLSNPGRVAPYYDITSDVQLGDNGFPTFNSIDGVAHQHLARFLEAAHLDDQ